MERTGAAEWLITWDTLARPGGEGGRARMTDSDLLRPRTLIYVVGAGLAVDRDDRRAGDALALGPVGAA